MLPRPAQAPEPGRAAPAGGAVTHLGDLERELTWFTQVLNLRFRLYFRRAAAPDDGLAAAPDDRRAAAPAAADDDDGDAASGPRTLAELPPPEAGDSDSAWARFVRERPLSVAERLAVVLALVPHLRPRLLDVFFTRNAAFDRRFTEFGGVRSDGDFEPTGETLAFLLGGDSLEARVEVARLLVPDHPLIHRDVVRPVPLHPGQPMMKAPLRISPELLSLFTLGHHLRSALGVDFPAQRLEISLAWEDLVLHPGTLRQIEELQAFILHGSTLMHDWGMAARLRPGYRALFYGPPGTGKTMSAALLGRLTGRDIYRVDLSLIVSKYIGETEKNLACVFDRAQQQGWILFFDEADALFGKRGETRNAHDRYANQEVAFLLQRLESFDGITILASNLRDNLDDAFTRRFESIVYFPLPRPAERLRLWTRGFSPRARLSADVDLEAIARDHDLSGGAIMNVIRQVSLAAIADGERAISGADLAQGVRRELAKDGR
ncbi:MAG: ATP-binding protein [Kofleriaceae bacterium]